MEGKPVRFGQRAAVPVAEVARCCLAVVGSTARIVTQRERQRPEESEVGLLLCDASKAKRLLKWLPRVSLQEGLRRTAEYIREHLTEYRTKEYVV